MRVGGQGLERHWQWLAVSLVVLSYADLVCAVLSLLQGRLGVATFCGFGAVLAGVFSQALWKLHSKDEQSGRL